jgi:hypothetical protein
MNVMFSINIYVLKDFRVSHVHSYVHALISYKLIQNYRVFGLCSSSKNPVILNIVHHRQNPLEST